METRRTRRSGALRKSSRALESASKDGEDSIAAPTAATRRSTRAQKAASPKSKPSKAKKSRSSSRSRKQEERKESGTADEILVDEDAPEAEQRNEEPNEDDNVKQENVSTENEFTKESETLSSRRRSRRGREEETKDSEQAAADENLNDDASGSDQAEQDIQEGKNTEKEVDKIPDSEIIATRRKSSGRRNQEEMEEGDSAAADGDQADVAPRSKGPDDTSKQYNDRENEEGDFDSLETSSTRGASRRLLGDEKGEGDQIDAAPANIGPDALASASAEPEQRHKASTDAVLATGMRENNFSKGEMEDLSSRKEGRDEPNQQLDSSSAASKNYLSLEKEVGGTIRKRDRGETEQLKGNLVGVNPEDDSSSRKRPKTDPIGLDEDSVAADWQKHDIPGTFVDTERVLLPRRQIVEGKGEIQDKRSRDAPGVIEAAKEPPKDKLRPSTSAELLPIHEEGHQSNFQSGLPYSTPGGSNMSSLTEINRKGASPRGQSYPIAQSLSNHWEEPGRLVNLNSQSSVSPRASEGTTPAELLTVHETAAAALVELFTSSTYPVPTNENGYQNTSLRDTEVDDRTRTVGHEKDLSSPALSEDTGKDQDDSHSILQEELSPSVENQLAGDEGYPRDKASMASLNRRRHEGDSGLTVDRQGEVTSATSTKEPTHEVNSRGDANTRHRNGDACYEADLPKAGERTSSPQNAALPGAPQSEMEVGSATELEERSTSPKSTTLHHGKIEADNREGLASAESVLSTLEDSDVSKTNKQSNAISKLVDLPTGSQSNVAKQNDGEVEEAVVVAKGGVTVPSIRDSGPLALAETETKTEAYCSDRPSDQNLPVTQGSDSEREAEVTMAAASAPTWNADISGGSTTEMKNEANMKLVDRSKGEGNVVVQISGVEGEKEVEEIKVVKSTSPTQNSESPVLLQTGINSVVESKLTGRSAEQENTASQESVDDQAEAPMAVEGASSTQNPETPGFSRHEMIVADGEPQSRSAGSQDTVDQSDGGNTNQEAELAKGVNTILPMHDSEPAVVSHVEMGSAADMMQADSSIVSISVNTADVRSCGDGDQNDGIGTEVDSKNEVLGVIKDTGAVRQPETPGKSGDVLHVSKAHAIDTKGLCSDLQEDDGQQLKNESVRDTLPKEDVDHESFPRVAGALTGAQSRTNLDSSSAAVVDRSLCTETAKKESPMDMSRANMDSEQSVGMPVARDKANHRESEKGSLEGKAEVATLGTGKNSVELESRTTTGIQSKKDLSDERDPNFDDVTRSTSEREFRPVLDEEVIRQKLDGDIGTRGRKRSNEQAAVSRPKRTRVEKESRGPGLPIMKASFAKNPRSIIEGLKVAIFSEGRVLHGRGYERIFAAYWEALSIRLEGNLSESSSKKSQAVFDSFLKTRKLRKLHNRLVLGLLKRCIRTEIPLEEISESLPLSWRGRVRVVSEDDTHMHHGRGRAAETQLVSMSTPYCGPMFSEPTKQVSLVENRPCISELRIPGALLIDPHVRTLGQSASMKVAENTIWMLVVAMKEYTSTVLKSSIAHRNAVEEGRLPPPTLPRAKMLAKKEDKAENNDASNISGAAATQSRCICAADIHAAMSSSSMGAIRSLGGTTSRLSFERTMFALPSTSHGLGGEAFGDIQRFISSQISPPVPIQLGGSNRGRDEPSVREAAKVRQRDRKSPSTGLGRGAKDLAALKARTSITAKSSSGVSGIPTAGASTPKAPVGTSVNPQGSASAFSVPGPAAPPCAPKEASQTSSAGSQKALCDSEQNLVVIPRPGKGFGVKNLAAMRARSLTLQRTGETVEQAPASGEGQQASGSTSRATDAVLAPNPAAQP